MRMTTTEKNDQSLTDRAVELAVQNAHDGGKPFACLVVDRASGEVLVEATNQVAQSGDKTAHAEMVAIRQLAEAGRDTLEGCDVYITAYPCPMCLGALYYAAPEQVVFAATREQEGEHYEDGNRYMSLATFYDEYAKPIAEQNLPLRQQEVANPVASFVAYAKAHPDA